MKVTVTEKIKNNWKWLLCVVIVLPILCGALSNYHAIDEVDNACVNTENGDIALTYYDGERNGTVLRVYDVTGHKLYEKFLPACVGTRMRYASSALEVYSIQKGDDMLVSWDRDGTVLEKIASPDKDNKSIGALYELDEWSGWDKTGNTRTFKTGSATYEYTESSWIKRIVRHGNCAMHITSSDGEAVKVYGSGSKPRLNLA